MIVFQTHACRPFQLAAVLLAALPAFARQAPSSALTFAALPDTPSALLQQQTGVPGTPTPDTPAQAADQEASRTLPPCQKMSWRWRERERITTGPPCQKENPFQSIVETGDVAPLTPSGKALLAVNDVIDPFNLATIAIYSTIAVEANAHSAYGPGLRGILRYSGYGLVETAQGEFFGTWLIPTLAQQDPRYHRMPGRPFPRRLLHAVTHSYITQHDNGTLMPNYATLLTYPISAELTNLYVPGIQTDGKSTVQRIGLGLATDPAGFIVAEFLPDVARHIHIRIVFVQEILNRVATGAPNAQ